MSTGTNGGGWSPERVVDYLREAAVELEVWRQNARSREERTALQRVTALIGQAAGELESSLRRVDPLQRALPLPGADGNPGPDH